MAFSNPFSSSSHSNATPSSSNTTSAETKAAIIQRLQAEAALSNARTLIQSITENCFEKCIPTPGSSFTSKDQTCLNACMEKYISLWNATSRAYIARAGREKPAIDALGGAEELSM
ncbi:hypothetical protein VTO42DRAFT_8032 [Malbranchea cinnamomea]